MMSIHTCMLFILLAITSAISFIDFRRQVIPDGLNLALALSGGLALFLLAMPSPNNAVLGAFGGAVFFYLLRQVYVRWRGVPGLGLGDVKFLGAAGLWVGATGLPWLLLFASMSGLVYALVQAVMHGEFDGKTRLAFGPHLGLGLVLTWLLITKGYL